MLKLLLILWLLAMASPSEAQSFQYGPDADGDSIILRDTPCTLQIPHADSLLSVQMVAIDGRVKFTGCWTFIAPTVLIQWEDGDGGRMNVHAFRRVVHL